MMAGCDGYLAKPQAMGELWLRRMASGWYGRGRAMASSERSGRDTDAGFQSPGKRKIIGWED